MSKRARILVIDDDENIIKTLALCLKSEGYSVDTAENGQEAIAKSNANFYNLAIVDWRLPDIEGTKLLSELKETTPKMAKIMLTGYPSMDNAMAAVNKRADAFLLKPVEFGALLAKIEELLKLQEEANHYSQAKVAEFIETRTKEVLEAKTNKKLVSHQ
jgi:two-component system response regulator GlrR